VPGDANYVDKIQVQLGTGDLPPVIYGGGYNLLDPALARNTVVDLTPIINADAEWKALFSDASLVTNVRDGKIYASSSEGSVIGYFYNKELFAKAGISAPAKTWEEFFRQCDQLKAAGITPLAMDTGDSAWVTMLWMGALVATDNAAGLAFVQQMMPGNYNTPEMIKAVAQIQNMLRNYTTLDAIGGQYEHAANNFLSGNVAMIANGPWMMGDFEDLTKTSAGFAAKVGTAIYPGSFVYDAPIQGYFVTKQKDPALQEAAIAMVKFFTNAHAQQIGLEIQGMVPSSPTVQITPLAKQKWGLLADFLDQANAAQYRSDNLQATMYPNLLDIVSQELPQLASGTITPERFCQLLTDGAAKNK
jgi:raffinose/stachyose/melibiose transport system substrate-binding protein